MQNFIRITFIGLILLIITLFWGIKGIQTLPIMPQWFLNYKMQVENVFIRPENANFIFAIFTGIKRGLSPQLIIDLKLLNLGFLLSPSGLHLTGILYFTKKIKKKFPWYLSFWLMPGLFSIKRMALLRVFSMHKKLKGLMPLYLTFLISFLCGHFFKSPTGYIYSFLFIGTFFSINEFSLIKSFLAISATHILLSFFSGNDFSFLAVFFTLIFVQLFSYLFKLIIIFLLSFYFIPNNFIEPIIRFYIILIHKAAKLTHGTFYTSSFMLLIAIWIILLRKNKKWVFLCLILHAELTHAPSVFIEGPTFRAQIASVHR